MDVNTAKIRRVNRPDEDTLLVAVDRLRHCPTEVPDAFWPPARQRGKKGDNQLQTEDVTHNKISTQVHDPGTSANEDRTQVAQEPCTVEPGEEVEQPKTLLDKESKSAKQVGRDCGPKQGECQKSPRGVPVSDLLVSVAERAVTKQAEEATASGKMGGKWADRLRKKPKKCSPRTCELEQGGDVMSSYIFDFSGVCVYIVTAAMS